jgi:hypothetical protein
MSAAILTTRRDGDGRFDRISASCLGRPLPLSDDLGRERLLRYGARPALAMDRLRRLPDGRIAFRVKYSRGRSKHRLMTPLELMARLAAIIPPPRYPLVRFHGVLGPRSSWRKDVVPKPRGALVCTRDETKPRKLTWSARSVWRAL